MLRKTKPLEMTSTTFEPAPEMEERLSIPYTVEEKTGRRAIDLLKKYQYEEGSQGHSRQRWTERVTPVIFGES